MTDIKSGKFRPVYLLMGEEPYYTDMILSALNKHVLAVKRVILIILLFTVQIQTQDRLSHCAEGILLNLQATIDYLLKRRSSLLWSRWRSI